MKELKRSLNLSEKWNRNYQNCVSVLNKIILHFSISSQFLDWSIDIFNNLKITSFNNLTDIYSQNQPSSGRNSAHYLLIKRCTGCKSHGSRNFKGAIWLQIKKKNFKNSSILRHWRFHKNNVFFYSSKTSNLISLKSIWNLVQYLL